MKETVYAPLAFTDGDLSISGVSLQTLAQECPTPLYIYDENQLVAGMKAYTENFISPAFEGRIVYATKAFNAKAMLKLCEQNGLYCDAVSLGEIYTAKMAGVDMKTVYFHGNNKTAAELRKAFEYGVGTIIVDSKEEAMKLAGIAAEYPDVSIRTLIRVNPIIEAHTHKHIQTAAPDSKFGIPITMKERLYETIDLLEQADNLSFCGVHAHIGSQIFETEPFLRELEELAELYKELHEKYGSTLEEIDLGGGFGVWYTDADTPRSTADICSTIVSAAAKVFEKEGIAPRILTIEPGRSIVAEAGYLLYRITMVKESLKDKFLFVDGGMSDLIRPALYEAKYTAELVGKPKEGELEKVTIAGKCCESGDIVIRDAMMPKAQEGDLLLICSAGAYGYSMASNYNKQPIPGVVFVKDGSWRYVIKPQSLEDMISRECD